MKRLPLTLLLLTLAACSSADLPTGVSSSGPVTAAPMPSDLSGTAGIPAHCTYRHAANGESLPDTSCTPGATDPGVTQSNIGTTICVSGYTRTVRPPVSYTEPLKTSLMARYGATGPASTYELDHLVPLELGGAPRDVHNLWPEPGASPNRKDQVEGLLHDRVCSRTMSLADAQQAIARDWTQAAR